MQMLFLILLYSNTLHIVGSLYASWIGKSNLTEQYTVWLPLYSLYTVNALLYLSDALLGHLMWITMPIIITLWWSGEKVINSSALIG